MKYSLQTKESTKQLRTLCYKQRGKFPCKNWIANESIHRSMISLLRRNFKNFWWIFFLSSIIYLNKIIRKIITIYYINSRHLFFIPELNLSHNRLSNLPGEVTEFTQLEKLDISNNSFVSLLPVSINSTKNFVTELYN